MKFKIKSRYNDDEVIFECDLSAEYKDKVYSLQLGFAVRKAVGSGANLIGANLINANLINANLRDANLIGANLINANLINANLRDAKLIGADLSGANLIGAYLRGVYLRDANLSGANLIGAYLRGVYLRDVPNIENIHQAVYQAASQPEALEMGSWHTCETTHCRAGWVTHLAGEVGAAMEYCLGTSAAAALIYLKSDPNLEKIPDFHCTNKKALADMKRLADIEAGKAV